MYNDSPNSPQELSKILKKQTGPLFVLSDIDGTLVPHPYFSGLTSSQRAHFIKRMAALCHCPTFGLVTGRTLEGFTGLYGEAGLAPSYPPILALEFGSRIFQACQEVYSVPTSKLLHQVTKELEGYILSHSEFRPHSPIHQQMATGKVNGFFTEIKKCIAQIEWYFDEHALTKTCASLVYRFLNPKIVSHSTELNLQLFQNRIDLMVRDFHPKGDVLGKFATRLSGDSRAVGANHKTRPLDSRLGNGASWHTVFDRLLNNSDTPTPIGTLCVLGDELYDSYLFADCKALEARVFEKVTCIAVRHRQEHADSFLTDEDQALTLLENLVL